MLHQNDVAVTDSEADVVLDVVEEHTPQRRDGDVSRGNLAARQTLIETGKPPLVVEDMVEERIFIGSFRLHAHASSLFSFILLYHVERYVARVPGTNISMIASLSNSGTTSSA